MFLIDTVDFSRRMDREGWIVSKGELVKNDPEILTKIKDYEDYNKNGKPKLGDANYDWNRLNKGEISSKAYRGRYKFKNNYYDKKGKPKADNTWGTNTGRPLSTNEYRKNLKSKIDSIRWQIKNGVRPAIVTNKPTQTVNPPVTNTKRFSTATATSTKNTATKLPRKLVNKYTLGAGSALLTAGTIYGAHKYANRDKKKKG